MEIKLKAQALWAAGFTPLGPNRGTAIAEAASWPLTPTGSRNAAKLARVALEEIKDINAARIKLCEGLCVQENEKPKVENDAYVFTPEGQKEFDKAWAELMEDDVVLAGVRPIWDGELDAKRFYAPEVVYALGELMSEKKPE